MKINNLSLPNLPGPPPPLMIKWSCPKCLISIQLCESSCFECWSLWVGYLSSFFIRMMIKKNIVCSFDYTVGYCVQATSQFSCLSFTTNIRMKTLTLLGHTYDLCDTRSTISNAIGVSTSALCIIPSIFVHVCVFISPEYFGYYKNTKKMLSLPRYL